SEHPSGLFAGLAETDPPFLWAGDTVGIALTVVAASRSPVRLRGYPADAPGDLPRVACAWQAHDRAAKGASPLSPGRVPGHPPWVSARGRQGRHPRLHAGLEVRLVRGCRPENRRGSRGKNEK